MGAIFDLVQDRLVAAQVAAASRRLASAWVVQGPGWGNGMASRRVGADGGAGSIDVGGH